MEKEQIRNSFPRRSIVLILIGLTLIAIGVSVLTEDKIVHSMDSGSIYVKKNSYNFSMIKILNGDILTINVYPRNNSFYVLLSKSSHLSPHDSINLSSSLGRNITFDYPSGEYYLIIVNRGEDTTYNYTVDYYRVRHVEKYNSAVSLTGISLLLVSLIILYNDIVSYYSQRYPDTREDQFISCKSIKLNKHVCRVKIPLPLLPDELSKTLKEHYSQLGYKTRKESENILILERSSFHPFTKKKPSLLVVNMDPYNLEFYYSIPHIRASGTIDLEWIYKEVRDYIYKITGYSMA